MTKICPSLFYPSILSLAFLALLSNANAQVITLTPTGNNLYNTGFDGTVPAVNNEPDTHYTLTNFGPGQTFRSNPPDPGWVSNPSGAQWITVSNSSNNGPVQIFDYKLVLTNIPVGSVVTISGVGSADDIATITAKSTSAGFSSSSSKGLIANYFSFSNFSGLTFVAGTTNEIDILVNNTGGGPTGLNLQLSGSYTPLANFKFDPAGLTQNQTAVLNNINQINASGAGALNSCFVNLNSALLGTSPANFGAAMDQLSPEKLGVFSSIAFNDASFRTQDIDDYLAHRRNALGNFQVYPGKIDTSGLTLNDSTMDASLSQVKSRLLAWSPTATPGLLSDVANPLAMTTDPTALNNPSDNWNIFVRGNVTLAQNLSQPEIDHTDYTTSSFQLGTDYQIGNNFLVGTLFDYSHTDTTLDGQGSSATIDSYSPGLFASYADGGWYANALATYSFNAYTEQRNISIGSFQESPSGAPEGDQELADLDGGYEFHMKQWTLGPTAGLQYTHLNVDPFTENGGCSSNLSVNNETADSLRSRLGGRISYAVLDRSDRVVFTPYLDASWQHEFVAGSRLITSSFSELSKDTFIVSTPNTSRDSALVVVGLDADITHNTTLFTDYQVQAGENDYFGQSVQAGMKVAF